MSEHGLTPQELRQRSSLEIEKLSTFETHGVSRQAALDYLDTPEGTRYLQILKEAAPNISDSKIVDRAIGQITSGRDLPRMEVIDEPLVKIVPAGVQDKSLPYSPFFAKESEFRRARPRP